MDLADTKMRIEGTTFFFSAGCVLCGEHGTSAKYIVRVVRMPPFMYAQRQRSMVLVVQDKAMAFLLDSHTTSIWIAVRIKYCDITPFVEDSFRRLKKKLDNLLRRYKTGSFRQKFAAVVVWKRLDITATRVIISLCSLC
jgi:hypothetical protein